MKWPGMRDFQISDTWSVQGHEPSKDIGHMLQSTGLQCKWIAWRRLKMALYNFIVSANLQMVISAQLNWFESVQAIYRQNSSPSKLFDGV